MLHERKPVILFDIDGTVANLAHRLHFITNGKNDWASFNAEIPKDTPIEQTIFLNNVLKQALVPAFDIIFASGRSEDERSMTEAWLSKHKVYWKKLYMRPSGDFRADYIIKREILDQIRADGYEPFIVIDDRQTVVDMWRANGLFVLQCDPHAGECRSDIYKFHKTIADCPLTIMVGPSGAGKSSMLAKLHDDIGQIVISSDGLREQICGDFKDQSQNERVFRTMHELAKKRLELGLPVILDATHIKRKDRLESLKCLPSDLPARYVVVNRPLHEKERDGGWRTGVMVGSKTLIQKHDQTFKSNLKDILAGDGQPNVTVVDLRKV